LTLSEFFTDYPKVAIAFSGGVDSAYLLYAAKQHAKEVRAYYVKSQFQPQFELDDALRLANELGADMKIIELDVLSVPSVSENSQRRCYYCKKAIFTAIMESAKADGYEVLLDGTNASDDASDRPGMQAIKELSVLSPLRACGLTKSQVRDLSKEAGLFTWDKPAYACLATRIKTGEEITAEKLEATESAEDFLFSIGFSDFRIRTEEGNAKIQIVEKDIPRLIEHRQSIVTRLKEDYKAVVLDLEVRG